jgi:outer membrane receptor protein involved in Fe transport
MPYSVFDMSGTTTWQNTQFQLNVKNLFDKEYAVSGFSERNGNFPGCTTRSGVAGIASLLIEGC